jgi:hypothetical protein
MRRFVSAAAIALIAGMGAASAARSATLNFAVSALDGASLGFTGGRLDTSTAFNFDGASLLVSSVGSGDQSGLSAFPNGSSTAVKLTPSDVTYGSGTGPSTLPTNLVEGWTGANNDVFTETLTTVKSIDRSTANAVAVFLTGTVTDSLGLFTDTPVNFILSGNQVGGPGTAISVGFTNTTILAAIPEPSTWAMMLLGFVGLGYAAVRRTSKDRSPLGI